MTDTYTAWDGNSYPWPPPEGWYEAADGRYWAPGTGPSPTNQPQSHAPVTASTALDEYTTLDAGDPFGTAGVAAGSFNPDEHDVTVRTDPTSQPDESSFSTSLLGAIPSVEEISPQSWPEPIANKAPAGNSLAELFEPSSAAQLPPVDNPFDPPPRSQDISPVVVQSSNAHQPISPPDLLRRADSWTDYEHVDHPNRSKLVALTMVGLVVVAAAIVVAVISTTSIFDSSTPTTQVASSAGADENPDSTSDVATQTAQAGTSPEETPTTNQPLDVAASPDKDSVDNFRQLLNLNGLTSGNLLPYELTNFGNAFCRYAEVSPSLSEFDVYRAEAISQTETDLTSDELDLVIDAAVVSFCPSEADRLGIKVSTQPSTSGD